MQSTAPKKTNTQAMLIIGLLFFVFGFVTWLNSTLIPFLRLVCQLSTDIQAFLVTTAFYMAYFFLALPSASILKKTGFKKGMSLGLFIMAVGSLIFIPAAHGRTFPLFLTGLFVQGMGLALLQTATNPYITIVGPFESAAKRISIMGICNKIAGILSPLILGALVLKDANVIEEKLKMPVTSGPEKDILLQELSQRVVTPYVLIAIVLALVGIFIWFSPLPEINEETAGSKDEPEIRAEEFGSSGPALVAKTAATTSSDRFDIKNYPNLQLGILCLFLYVGVEVMAGDAIGIYGHNQGLPLSVTKTFTSFTLGAMLLGYIAGIFAIPKFLSQQQALRISAVLGILFTLGALFSTGYAAITFIALLGLANALMWPAIFPLAIAGLGKHTKTASALLVMGIAGGAILPLLYSTLKDKAGLSNAVSFFLCTFPCYLYILYYAMSGYRTKQQSIRLTPAV